LTRRSSSLASHAGREPESSRDRRGHSCRAGGDPLLLGVISALISLASLVFYFRRGAILLYGDAVAHINIARRVFDSQTPGVLELGTVWLPLPHLLDTPLIANDWMWRTGLGASLPSMAAYVAGTLGIFCLVRGHASRFSAWIASLTYALNPNLIYMQATAMTEALYLALFIWAVAYLSSFVQIATQNAAIQNEGGQDEAGQKHRGRRLLERCAMMVSAAMLVRYDGWFLMVAVAAAFLLMSWSRATSGWWRRGAIHSFLLMGLTAGVWLAYNHGAFWNALEFMDGPYSARAILRQSSGAAPYPGQNDLRTAARYFVKAAALNLGENGLECVLLVLAFAAMFGVIYFARRYWPWLLLWAPAPFYAMSIAWGGVPVYFPAWPPHSYYNTRYGLQMLPAIAVFAALGAEFLSRFASDAGKRTIRAGLILIVVTAYAGLWWKTPICLREAEANGRARMIFDEKLAEELRRIPASATLMMYCGAHSGAAQRAGVPLRRILREGNHPGWEIGLNGPARAADYVIAIPDDPAALAVRLFPENLEEIARVDVSGQPAAVIFRSRK